MKILYDCNLQPIACFILSYTVSAASVHKSLCFLYNNIACGYYLYTFVRFFFVIFFFAGGGKVNCMSPVMPYLCIKQKTFVGWEREHKS